jgi:hypothetical protein
MELAVDLIIDVETSRMFREVIARIQAQNLGEAFIGLPITQPLLTTIVPDGMRSSIRKDVSRG